MAIYKKIEFTPAPKKLVIKPLFHPSFNQLKGKTSKKARINGSWKNSKLDAITDTKHMNGSSQCSIVHLFKKEESEYQHLLKGSNGVSPVKPILFANGISPKVVNGNGFASPEKTTPRLLNGNGHNGNETILISYKPGSSSNKSINGVQKESHRPLVAYSDSESEEEDSDDGNKQSPPLDAVVKTRIVGVTVREKGVAPTQQSFPPSSTSNAVASARSDSDDSGDEKEKIEIMRENVVNAPSPVQVYGPQLPPNAEHSKSAISSTCATSSSASIPSIQSTSLSPKKNTVDIGPLLPSPSKLKNGELVKKEKMLVPPVLMKKKVEAKKQDDLIPAMIIKKFEGSKLISQDKKITLNLPTTLKNGELKPKIGLNGESSKNVNGQFGIKRTSDMSKDGPVSQRRRLLSERGEEERKHPMIDRAVITHWKWANTNKIGNRRYGAGLLNNMNDCFLNSVMQIVTHTAPLACFIYTHKYDPARCRGDFCILCKLRKQIVDAFSSTRPIFNQMVKCTKQFFKSHSRGQQADAHEAFLLLLDAIDGIALPGVKSKSTPSEQIFGMTLRYRGYCKKCGKDSNGYERVRVLELCMDKWRSTNTTDLLQNFFKTESLSDYKCEKCNCRGFFSRRTQLLRAPAVLILQIQRFAFMRKVKDEVIPTHSIDLHPYLVDQDTPDSHGPAQYVLRGVVDHLGFSIDSGHYRSFHADVAGEQWVEFDDELVRRTDFNSVKKEVRSGCYLLIYHRKSHT